MPDSSTRRVVDDLVDQANVLVVAAEGDVATARSKGIGILTDGESGTVVYEDLVRRTGVGW